MKSAANGKQALPAKDAAFLEAQARKENNAPFMSLIGRILPTQLAADPDDIGPPVIILRKFTADGPEVPLIEGDWARRD
jgi:hypothetical protein